MCACARAHTHVLVCRPPATHTKPQGEQHAGRKRCADTGAARGTSSTPTQADATPGAFKDLSAERSACPAHSAAAWAPKHQAVADRRNTCQHSCQGGAECHPVPHPCSPLTCATHMARLRVPTKKQPQCQQSTAPTHPLTQNDMHGNPPTNQPPQQLGRACASATTCCAPHAHPRAHSGHRDVMARSATKAKAPQLCSSTLHAGSE